MSGVVVADDIELNVSQEEIDSDDFDWLEDVVDEGLGRFAGNDGCFWELNVTVAEFKLLQYNKYKFSKRDDGIFQCILDIDPDKSIHAYSDDDDNDNDDEDIIKTKTIMTIHVPSRKP